MKQVSLKSNSIGQRRGDDMSIHWEKSVEVAVISVNPSSFPVSDMGIRSFSLVEKRVIKLLSALDTMHEFFPEATSLISIQSCGPYRYICGCID